MTFAKKKYGQHFLTNISKIEAFIEAVRTVCLEYPNCSLIEMGPGNGALTRHLTECNRPLTLYEIDKDMIQLLKVSLKQAKDTTIIHTDFLDYIKKQTLTDTPIFVSNLPYNIGSRVIIELSLQTEWIPPMVVGLQKEVATKLYTRNSFSLFAGWCQLVWKTEHRTDIAAGNFSPPPKVTSALVISRPCINRSNWLWHRRKECFTLLKQLTRYPSKTIRNNLYEHQRITVPKELQSERISFENYQQVLEILVKNT